MDPVAFRLGPVAIYWYGIVMVAGVVAGLVVAAREANRRGEDADHIWNGFFLVALLAMVGARLYHVFSSPAGSDVGWDFYRRNPLSILDFRSGGIGIYGALAGGVTGILLYTWWRKLNLLRWLDIVAMGMPLAQAIGRWGNFFNQELYGYPTRLPWGIHIPPENRLPGFEAFERFHPVFFYESLWCLIVLALMMWGARRLENRLKDGDIVLAYFVLYPLGRIFTEALRPDSWTMGPVRVAQAISVLLILGASVALFLRHRHDSRGD
jgi:phosphatidylglycerol:prolipoprotein diacylglycerol transferase